MSGSRCEGSGSDMVCNAAPLSSGTSGSGGEAAQPFKSITPRLGTSIPGLELTDATKEESEVIVPFLAQYINAVYRYGVTVVLVIAIVMVVYGGFRYLVGSSLGDIQTGKKIIQDALIGMLIVLGAYMLLNTVNPSTVNLSVLKLVFVDEMQLLLTIETPTGDWEVAETGAEPAAAGEVNPVISSGIRFTPPPPNPYSSCPVSLSEPISTSPYRARDARVEEFLTEASSVISAGGARARVLAAAGAAVNCDIHMGSCGNSTRTINGFAGVSGSGNRKFSIGSDNVRFLTETTQNCVRTYPDSKSAERRNCKVRARASAYERFSSNLSSENWPNGPAAMLEPGDHLWIYTVHSGGAGQHAMIFLGWAGPGRARVFNGQWEGSVRESTFCITTDCRNLYPITQIWSPD